MTLHSSYIDQGRRNALFNGNFDSWPGGLGPFTAGDTACNWLYGHNGAVVCNAAGSSASKPNNTSKYVYKLEVTTADASMTDTDYVHTFYNVEGYDFAPFIGQTATISFWVRSSVTGIYSLFMRNYWLDRSYIAEFTINTPDTWEKKEITVKFDYVGGTWNYTNGQGINIGFAPACGTTFSTSTIGEWVSSNLIASSNQVSNWAATVGNTFQFAQMQMELGNTSSQFESLPWAAFEELVNRYYFSIYLYVNATCVGTGTGNGYVSWDFPSIMRAAPTITHPGTNQMWNGTWIDATAVNHSANSYRCLTTMQNTTSGYVIGSALLILMTSVICDARL